MASIVGLARRRLILFKQGHRGSALDFANEAADDWYGSLSQSQYDQMIKNLSPKKKVVKKAPVKKAPVKGVPSGRGQPIKASPKMPIKGATLGTPKKAPVTKAPEIPQVIRNKYGGYEYNPAFVKDPAKATAAKDYDVAVGGVETGYGKTGMNSQSPYDPYQQNGGMGIDRPVSTKAPKLPTGPGAPVIDSQSTYVIDGKRYHAQTGTFISDLAAEKDYNSKMAAKKTDAKDLIADGDPTGAEIKGYNNTVTIKSGGKTIKYKRSTLLQEAKTYGDDYIKQKYGDAVYKAEKKNIDFGEMSRGRSFDDGGAGNSSLNGIRPVTSGANFDTSHTQLAFQEGGSIEPAPAAFAPQKNFNLSNNKDLAQGHETEWAQPTTISALISGQLRMANTAGSNYWDVWSQDKGGTTSLAGAPTSPFSLTPKFTPNGAGANMAQTSQLGAFGTSSVMGPMEDAEAPATGQGNITTAAPAAGGQAAFPGAYAGPASGGPNAPKPTTSNVYNPWASGEGGQNNAFGPSKQSLGQSTMEAMALANAYFAPQRLEMASQLGDMETDMRRLAVNLGRQTDDPILQAKLYKEAMTATRAMDVQQNTFAFQMAEQRRQEENTNFQFYDQLAQEEYRLRLANAQFYDNLDLQGAAFNLQRWQVENAPGFGGGGSSPAVSAGAPASTGGAPPATAATSK